MEHLDALVDESTFSPAEFTASTPNPIKPILRRHSFHSVVFENNKNVSFDLDRNDVFVFSADDSEESDHSTAIGAPTNATNQRGCDSTGTRSIVSNNVTGTDQTDATDVIAVDNSEALEITNGGQNESEEQQTASEESQSSQSSEESDWSDVSDSSEESEPSPVKQPKYFRARLPLAFLPPKKPLAKRFQKKPVKWSPRIMKHHKDVVGLQMSKFFLWFASRINLC